MRVWARAQTACLCGGCGHPIPIGAAVQTVTLAGLRRTLVRCEGCAEGDAPPDLPPGLELGQRTKPMEPIRRVASRAVAEDFKLKQAGR